MSRTNIEIDDGLMAAAMKATGLKTKKAVVEEGLQVLARREMLRQVIRDTAGIGWDDGTSRLQEIAEDGIAFQHTK